MNKNEEKALTWATVAMHIKDLGYRYLGAYFDGSGDSGYIEEIIASNDLEKLEENNVWDIHDGINIKKLNLSDELQRFVSDELDEISSSQDDWWNNEGGYGKCIIDLNSNEYNLDIDIRVAKTINYTYHSEKLTK
jgi:hypothetical protein